MDQVVILLDLEDGTWDMTQPMPRWVADIVCFVFGHYAEPWNGKRVTGALLIPREDRVH